MKNESGYRELETWQKAMDLVTQAYSVSAQIPAAERFGLCSQIRRAAVSIPSNIAEGHCRRTTRAYANHVSIALGSQGELETCLEIARRLKMLRAEDAEHVAAACANVGMMLSRLYQALERKIVAGAGGSRG